MPISRSGSQPLEELASRIDCENRRSSDGGFSAPRIALVCVVLAGAVLFYNALALLERVFTSWHSSFRQK